MRPTIYDVAQKAEVSMSTVSMVMNNKGSISDATRKKVMKVLEELQFISSRSSIVLKKRHAYTVGLLIPNLENPLFVEIARNVCQRGHELGLSVVICNTENDSEKEVKYITRLKEKNLDGLILAGGFENDAILQGLVGEGLPIVLIGQNIPSLGVDSVHVDDFLGGYQVTEHFLSLGHQTIAVFAENTRSSKERLHGYRQAINDAGLEYNESLVFVCDSTVSSKQLAKQILGLTNRPTAIFACNDLLAVGIMQGAKERGLRVPHDLSIIGFDNTILSRSIDPPLTSVDQPIEEMGRQGIDLLIERIEGNEKTKRQVILFPKVIFRNSTKTHPILTSMS